jgi:hypothetical protein
MRVPTRGDLIISSFNFKIRVNKNHLKFSRPHFLSFYPLFQGDRMNEMNFKLSDWSHQSVAEFLAEFKDYVGLITSYQYVMTIMLVE